MSVSSTSVPVPTTGADTVVKSSLLVPPYPLYRTVWECTAVMTGVGLIVFALPLGSRGYLELCVAVSAIATVYGAYGLWRVPGTPRRWGLIGNPRRTEGIVYGFGGAALMTALGAVPVVVGRSLIAHPPLAFPPLYSLWCVVQDFVFFSLFLRNLVDRIPKSLAVGLTAILFGLSHYPFTEMVTLTAVAAVVWGYIYATSRVLWFVLVPHLLLGYLLLG
jgi:membrane protease YdiL (CAAX protease family)